MESVKPVVEQEAILSLLREVFDSPVQELTVVEGGLTAQVLSFRTANREYVLRINPGSFDAGFRKEAFIYQNFASPSVPIPPIVRMGQLENHSYTITQKMLGQGLQSLTETEYEKILPSLIQTLYAIHQSNVQRWKKYGLIGDDGNGMFPSWENFLAKIIEEERPDGFYGKWHSLFQTTFLERDFFERVYRRMLDLLKFCPEERYLVHGGYGFNNVLAVGDKVTAVLDWVDAMYGDFVFDIAKMDFWPSEGIDHSRLIYEYDTRQGMVIPHYRERIACYQCYGGLDALRFFAKTNNHDAYLSTRQILQGLLSE
jgi:hygromycin-B 4-O-kinase